MFGITLPRGNLSHSNFKKPQTSFFNQTTHTNAFPKSLIFSATKYLKIKSLSHRPFEKPYLEGSGFAELPYLHQNSPYIHEFPSGIVPSVEIANLRDNPGAKKRKRIVGRGIGCRKGKTSGRGHKGQKSRSGGGTRPGFEGGVPFYKRVRKFGFSNAMFKQEYTELNLDRLQYFFDSGRLTVPIDRPLNIRDLKVAGVLPRIKNPVKLLGEGKTWFKGPKEGVLNIEVQATSKDARSCVEATGGKVTTVYFNKLGLRHFLKFPHDEIKIKFARCVKHPEKYDMPRFIPYDQRTNIEEEGEENFEEEEEGEVEEQQQ